MNFKDVEIDKIKLYITSNKLNNSLATYIKIGYDINKTKFIIQTPKLKVGYSAKKFESNGRYNYCYSLNLEDNDDFINFLLDCEKYIITKIDEMKQNEIIKNKNKMEFFSSLYNPQNSDDIYFKIKLLTDKNNDILTKIHLINRDVSTFESIISGNLLDQYIELDGISITNDGKIYLIWYAHQIVVSPYEKLFIKKLLIDELTQPISSAYMSSAYMSSAYMSSAYNMSSACMSNVNNNIISKPKEQPIIKKPILKLDQDMLLNMKAKLKSSNK